MSERLNKGRVYTATHVSAPPTSCWNSKCLRQTRVQSLQFSLQRESLVASAITSDEWPHSLLESPGRWSEMTAAENNGALSSRADGIVKFSFCVWLPVDSSSACCSATFVLYQRKKLQLVGLDSQDVCRGSRNNSVALCIFPASQVNLSFLTRA